MSKKTVVPDPEDLPEVREVLEAVLDPKIVEPDAQVSNSIDALGADTLQGLLKYHYAGKPDDPSIRVKALELALQYGVQGGYGEAARDADKVLLDASKYESFIVGGTDRDKDLVWGLR